MSFGERTVLNKHFFTNQYAPTICHKMNTSCDSFLHIYFGKDTFIGVWQSQKTSPATWVKQIASTKYYHRTVVTGTCAEKHKK